MVFTERKSWRRSQLHLTIKAQKTAVLKLKFTQKSDPIDSQPRKTPVERNMSSYNDTFDTSNVCTAPLGKYDQNLLPLKYVSLWLAY